MRGSCSSWEQGTQAAAPQSPQLSIHCCSQDQHLAEGRALHGPSALPLPGCKLACLLPTTTQVWGTGFSLWSVLLHPCLMQDFSLLRSETVAEFKRLKKEKDGTMTVPHRHK